jgi:hypothetical protein
MDFDFGTGMEFGRALEKLRAHGDRLDHLDGTIETIQAELRGIKTTIGRGGLLAALWASGGTAWASQDKAGELIAGAIKALFRLG